MDKLFMIRDVIASWESGNISSTEAYDKIIVIVLHHTLSHSR